MQKQHPPPSDLARYVAIDTETHLIGPDKLPPQLVCVAIATASADVSDDVELYHAHHDREPLAARLWSILQDAKTYIVGQNIVFDVLVLVKWLPGLLPLFVQAYRAGRICDTMLASLLHGIATDTLDYRPVLDDMGQEIWQDGKRKLTKASHTLSSLAERLLGEKLSKGLDTWRLRYSELSDTPISAWPPSASWYAKTDALTTFEVWRQILDRADWCINLADLPRQTAAHFALEASSKWGLAVDPDAVRSFERDQLAKKAEASRLLREKGLLTASWTLNTAAVRKAAEMAAFDLGLLLEMTAPSDTYPEGQISVTADFLKKARAKPELAALLTYKQADHMLNTYVSAADKAREGVVRTSYWPLLATGRTSSRDPNLQQVPAKIAGPREMYVARPGYALVSVDYAQLELCTLAQVCVDLFGESPLADAINLGKDLHCVLAAEILGRPYEDVLKQRKTDPEVLKARNTAKAINFALPGGMGPPGLQAYLAQQGIDVDLGQAKELRDTWLSVWGMAPFFRYVSQQILAEGGVWQVRAPRFRASDRFTACCNTLFQGMAADAAKTAVFEVFCATLDSSSPLYGSGLWLFVHDEILIECPLEQVHEAGEELKRIMLDALAQWCPDVKGSAEPAAMLRWAKAADTVRDEQGRLGVWHATP